MQLIIRILGISGLAASVLSFQFKRHKGIVLCKMLSELLFAVQYFFMGAYTGGLLDLTSGVRNFLFYKCVEKKRSTLPVIIGFSALVVTLALLSWAGPVSLLPMAAKVLTTVSYGMKNERLLRFITLPSCFCWIAYNAVVGNWEGIISDSLSLVSILIAVYKFDILAAKKDVAEEEKV